MFQSTRPCGARRATARNSGSRVWVSIHAPVRGATNAVPTPVKIDQVSIHAPVRGATSPPPCSGAATTSFNPRARAGRDIAAMLGSGGGLVMFQSTRPCGARPLSPKKPPLTYTCFNPRARAGRDAQPSPAPSPGTGFNPRARAGRDTSSHELEPPSYRSFNPRARAGRDARLHVRGQHRSFNPRARAGRDLILVPLIAL